MKSRINSAILILICFALSGSLKAQTEIRGELKQWHKVTLTFTGPECSETGEKNPFLDYRLNVTFSHALTGKSYLVPGYFAADGNAGNTGADSGDKWRAHFAPDETGEWTYSVDFRNGMYAAVSEKKNTGESGKFMDGESGVFSVAPTDKNGVDFRAKGRLQYVNDHYLRFAGTGEYFLKCGADAPENFLAYVDFDGTFHNDGHKDKLVKTWEAHLKDWKEGDPTWKDGKGKAMIGALNYLASEEMNAFSFLTMNIKGDDQNVFPYIDYDTYDRMDVSKLDQWEVVFEHAQNKGLFLHFKTQEVENQGLLDGGGLGAERSLYYRELIARFGHHLALNWNMGEEIGDWAKNKPTPPQHKQQRLAMARYFYEHDPYRHHVVIHNGAPFHDLLGHESTYTGISLQTHKEDFSQVHSSVLNWRRISLEAGKTWAIAVDEPGDATHSLLPDSDNAEHNNARKNGLWGALTAGAWGLEWYFGYKHDHSDLSCQDWRSRDLFWDQCRHALNFFKGQKVPFWTMEPNDGIVSKGYCLAAPGEVYVLFIPEGGTADLQLTDGSYSVSWFDPRNGGEMQNGSVKKLSGNGTVNVGNAPADADKDWVVLVKNLEPSGVLPGGKKLVLNAIKDFKNIAIGGFAPAYRDEYRKALAVDAAAYTGQTGAATHVFEGGSGTYEISLTILLETDGESIYRVKIGDTYLSEFQNMPTEKDYVSAGSIWKNVRVNNGELIQVEFSTETNGKIPEGDTTAFSRGRWTGLSFQPVSMESVFDTDKHAFLETGEGDKANDCYLKLEGADGWLGEFTKFVLLGDSFKWNWNVMGENGHHNFEAPEYKLKKGMYTIQIAGRSKNFVADRIVLFKVDAYEEAAIFWPE